MKKLCAVCKQEESAPAHGKDYTGEDKHGFVVKRTVEELKALPDDFMIAPGGSLKALGDGKFEGFLVRFSTKAEPDLTNDYFTKSTQFFVEDGAVLPVMYDHGLNKTLKRRKIGRAKVAYTDAGLFIKGELNLADDYEKLVYEELVAKGKAGLSSGAATHMMERKSVGEGINEILEWGIAEASITPAPTEFRNKAVATLKSLADDHPEDPIDEFLKCAHSDLESIHSFETAHGGSHCVHCGQTEDGGSHKSLKAADEEEGVWRTMRGARVFIQDGKITKGPKHPFLSADEGEEGKGATLVAPTSRAFLKDGNPARGGDTPLPKGWQRRSIDSAGKKVMTPSGEYEVRVDYHNGHYATVYANQTGSRSNFDFKLGPNVRGGEKVEWSGLQDELDKVASELSSLPNTRKTKKALDEEEEFEDRSLKSMFEERMNRVNPSIWPLREALSDVLADVAQAARLSDITGNVINVDEKVTDAVTEYAARLVPLAQKQVHDYLENPSRIVDGISASSSESRFYLKTFEPVTNLESFLSVKSTLVSGVNLDEHSARVVSAVGEFAAMTKGFGEGVRSWLKRCTDKLEFRRNADSKRLLADATVEKLKAFKTDLETTVPELTKSLKDVDELIATVESKSLSDADALDLDLVFIQHDLEMAGALPSHTT